MSPVEIPWRVIVDEPLPGARNMALDEALARMGAGHSAVLRLYGWDEPTVSLGRNEPTADSARDRVEIPIVRRPTGGRAVLHANEVTYAIAAPYSALGGARTAYTRINAALATALESLGAPVRLAQSDGTSVEPLDAGPCFQSPAPGEVVAGGSTAPDGHASLAADSSLDGGAPRKLVGSAQVRIGRTLLQHGSILLSGDQTALIQIDPSAADHPQPATLEELIGAVDVGVVADAVRRAIQDEFAGDWSESVYSPEEWALAKELVATKYGTDAWTWRR